MCMCSWLYVWENKFMHVWMYVCVCVCASEIKPFMCSVVEKRWQYAVEELVPAHTPG